MVSAAAWKLQTAVRYWPVVVPKAASASPFLTRSATRLNHRGPEALPGGTMNTFTKEERLCSRTLIKGLFSGGSSFFVHPFAVHYQLLPVGAAPYPAQVTFVVSKKRFKRAVDRNLLKRRMREAYRLNKANFYEQMRIENKQLVFLVSYSAQDIQSFDYLQRKLIKMLDKLLLEIKQSTP